ncbi:MAG TPA: GxGYxYP domain-containing protein, partial [bacterium]
MNRNVWIFYAMLIILLPLHLIAANKTDLNGEWILIPEKSTDIDLWGDLSLKIQTEDNNIIIVQTWGKGSRAYKDSLFLQPDGAIIEIPIDDRVFASNVFMGLSMPIGERRQLKASWDQKGTILKVTESYNVRSSQGKMPMVATHTYELSKDQELLLYKIHRSTRPSGPEIKYVLKRAGAKTAYFMNLEDDWTIDGKLPQQAFLISLQGLANQSGPRLYFVYPEKWDFRFTPDVYNFLKNDRNYSFTQLKTTAQALKTCKDYVKGYVVWDKAVRTSLIVAFTVAGLEQAVVISEELIPMVERENLKMIADFRGKFTGQTDFQIYSWAYDQYWERCSKEYIVWMGGEHGNIMKPGVADWGITKKAFFNDLSTKESDVEEYGLANKLLSEMKPMSFVFGWHSYKKDKERDHVKLTSSYALRVEGLHTLPNMSF